jgi:nucleotide-binding universal stress UspA family protein
MKYTINKILAAIDFSESSLNALDTAVFLAEKYEASLYILHVQDNTFEFVGEDKLSLPSIANHSGNILTALSVDIERKTKNKPHILGGEGYAPEVILRNAIRYECDLIVLGTYGASGSRDGFVGTTTYNVIKYASCPVLSIPPGKKWLSFKRPFLPVRPVISVLKQFDVLRNFLFPGAHLDMLGLSSGQPGARKDLDRLIAGIWKKLQDDNVTARTDWDEAHSVAETVLRHAEKNNTDLIIITPSIDISAKQFYIGPNAHKIIHSARIPVLNINKVNVHTAANYD